MISAEEHRERMALYNKGLSDREMAKLLYLDLSTVLFKPYVEQAIEAWNRRADDGE